LQPKTTLEAMEQLAILKRWYYRSSRSGEIFFAGENGELPIRRIVRGMARVFRGEKSEAETKSMDHLAGSGHQEEHHERNL
jgi:excinuclease ABC subunit C